MPFVSRRAVLHSSIAAATASLLGGADASALTRRRPSGPLGGINLAGADFGSIPGKHGRDYLYPTNLSVRYYNSLGFQLFRLPFKWERLQPDLNEPFSPGEQDLLVNFVRDVIASGSHVILDPH